MFTDKERGVFSYWIYPAVFASFKGIYQQQLGYSDQNCTINDPNKEGI